ncbi:MAG: stage V sporulation protein AE [Christensenellales bacterium]
MDYVYAFVIGGLLCVIAQVLMDLTSITPGKILVLYVTTGVVLGAFGIYDKLVEIAGAGATVPLTGFGNALAKGAIKAAGERGIIGAFTGGMTGTAAGVAAAIVFGYAAALIFKPKAKK